MESLHTKRLTKIISLSTVIIGLVICLPVDSLAQDRTSPKKYPPHLQKKLEQMRQHLKDQGQLEQSANQLQPRQSGVDLQTLSAGSEYTVLEHDQEWNRNPNPNPQNNFALFGQGQPAGDINGDGKDDFVVVDLARDEQTSALEDQIWKTAVFFGGNTSGTPDQLIRQKLIPIGDLNGDGYSDAVGRTQEATANAYIFKGTSNGYSKTNTDINGSFGYKPIGFNDYNNDGYDDILSYHSQTFKDFFIHWGSESISDINNNPTVYYDKLLSGPKNVVIDDIDKDSLKELIEFTGTLGDGQIRITEIDSIAKDFPSDAILLEQTFAFNSFSDDASQNEIHLIDINGDDYLEIFISTTGRNDADFYSDKYVIEYDSLSGSYLSSPINYFRGSLVPAGDLNNDGKHDFIRGDSLNDYEPYIAYGNNDLNTAPELDVPLSGNGGNDWSWNMGYNPYSNFGDLTGDGVDDVLMSHSRNDDGSETVGRRILNGASETSDFHQYPRENYLSRVWETEDVGDLNGDGIDDFVMGLYDQQQLEIYVGGASLNSPSQTLDLTFKPRGMTAGDFNDDGYSDIVVGGYGENGSTFSVFLGGTSISSSATMTVNASELQEGVDFTDFFNPQNIGDVNNDGVEDFLIGSSQAHNVVSDTSQYINEAYIFYGESSISATPQTISLGSSTEYIWAGETSAKLGDINNDGIDDFAVSGAFALSENNGQGQVYIYYGSSSPNFTEPDVILHAPPNTYGFGWGITAGDFTGNGVHEIAVSSVQNYVETGSPILAQVFIAGPNMDTVPDKLLSFPNFMFENSVGTDGFISYTYGRIETVSDFTNDGKDELLFGTAFNGSHAALYTFNDPYNETYSTTPTLVLKAPNRGAALGSENMALSDFDDDGKIDVILAQQNDDNDAYSSSRVYRYGLPTPIQITSVEDVPNDQGGKVRLNLGGAFADAIFNEGIVTSVYEFEVEYLDENDEWTGKGKYGADVDPSGADYLEVDGLTTQPSNTQSVDNSYTFRVKLLNGQDPQPMAISEPMSGAALDNIAPAEVTGVDINGQGAPVISWSPVDDVADIDYLIYSADDNGQLSNSSVASTTNTSFSLPETYEGVQSFAVKARDANNNMGVASTAATAIYPKTIDYDVRQGWNLIGLPVNADAEAIQAVLDAAGNSAIYEYDGGYQEVEQLKAGQGYWAKFSATDLHQLEGLPVTELTLNFDKGWNLVSGVGGKLPLDTIQDTDEIILPSTLYSFDQAYTSSDTLQPGNGYWIRASSAGTVTFVHPKLQPTEGSKANQKNVLAKKAKEVEDEFTRVTISDGSHSRELLFGAELPDHINRLSYSLPPLPPGDVFDARFEGDMRLVEKESAEVSLSRIEGSSLSLKVGTENGAEHSQFVVKELVNGNVLAEYQVAAGDEFSLKHTETNAVSMAPVGSSVLSDQEIPGEFKLKQNYPNPFNPSTQIHYSVTEASSVQLEVFNILGRRVATLVNKEQQPGNYKVTFDASHLASGVYLYRLRAGAQVSTKKLILAK